MNRSSAIPLFVKTMILLIFMSISAPPAFAGADVYLIYSGKNKVEKSEIKKAMPADVKVKAYNADLLAVADYSGKQKAAAKFDRAKLVIILKDRPMEMLKGISINQPVIVVNSVKTTVTSTRKIRYLLSSDMETSGLEAQFKLKAVSSVDDLSEGSLFRIEANGPTLTTLLSHLVRKLVQP